MVLTQDFTRAVAQLDEEKTISDFVPQLLVYLARAQVRTCQMFARLEPNATKVATVWSEVSETLESLAQVLSDKCPESKSLPTLDRLRREAAELASFYSEVPSLS
jgi:hypothetical protein